MKRITLKTIETMKPKNKKGIFLGCGESINELSKSNIDYINNNFDGWTSNSFMINKEIVPDFYHLEVKEHRNGPLVKRILEERSELYKDTKWIIDGTRLHLLNKFNINKYNLEENFYIYPKYYRKEENGNYNPIPTHLGVSLSASLSLICDAIITMNYDEFYFLGVDMYDSKYFWTDNKKYENVKIEDIIKTCKPDERKPESIHPTYKMKNFIKEIFSYNNKKVINLSSKSLLREVIETKQINEVLNERN